MKFFLDENFPKSATRYLTQRGHEVIDVRSTPREGMEDQDIFQRAQEASTVFLTTDRDFFHTVPFRFPTHAGVIVITLRQSNRTNILAKLTWAIEESGIQNFHNTILLLRDKSYSIKR